MFISSNFMMYPKKFNLNQHKLQVTSQSPSQVASFIELSTHWERNGSSQWFSRYYRVYEGWQKSYCLKILQVCIQYGSQKKNLKTVEHQFFLRKEAFWTFWLFQMHNQITDFTGTRLRVLLVTQIPSYLFSPNNHTLNSLLPAQKFK